MDLTGTNINTHNSFPVLDDDDIYARALEMAVSSESFSLEKINHRKDLEVACHSRTDIHENNVVDPCADTGLVLLLGFGEEREDEMEEFTPFISRRTKKRMISTSKKSVRGTLAKSGVASG
jgi:ActR/RegA family two-component response regulator